jgi:hypothetical protein
MADVYCGSVNEIHIFKGLPLSNPFCFNPFRDHMKTLYLCLVCSFLSSTIFAQLERIILEEQQPEFCDAPEAEPPVEGLKVFHLYAELTSDQYEFASIETQESCSPVIIQTSTDFFNTPAGTVINNPNFNVLCAFVPEIAFDSFISIGSSLGITPTVFTDLNSPNELEPSLFDNPGSATLDFEHGSIFVLPGGQGVPDENLRVFLGQFSTTGVIDYQINVGIYDTQTEIVHYYYNSECSGLYPLETPIYYEGVDGVYNLTGTSSNCTDPEACNYNQNLNPELDDPSTCNYTTCLGCMDENACDYLPFASIDDGSCNTTCEGCTDPEFTNYDPNADIDDGSCANIGCDYPLASNYNPEVTIVDDSCIILGCTDPSICNYNPIANEDDGSCDSLNCPGCTDAAAVNYNPQAITDNGSCHVGPLVNLLVEASSPGNIPNAPNATVTRVYAQLNHPDARVQKVYGANSCSPLSISSDQGFINNDYYFEDIFPYDLPEDVLETVTWITIGDPELGAIPTLITTGDLNIYDVFTFGLGNTVESEAGGWQVLSNPQPLDAQNRVLLGQFVTEGSLGYELNLAVIDENGITHNYLHSPCIDGNSVYAPNANLVYQESYCNDPTACNYEDLQMPDLIDNTTCEYETCYKDVNGFVFVDDNGNGVKDPGEMGIQSVDVHISNPEVTVQTDSQGYYDFGTIQIQDPRTITKDYINNYPYITTPLFIELTEANADNITKDFGMHNQTPEYGIEIASLQLNSSSQQGIQITCNGSLNWYQIELQNTGNLMQNGFVEIVFDDNFLGTPIYFSGQSTISENSLSFSFINLFPLETQTFYFGVGGPGVESIGEDLTVEATGNVLVNENIVFSTTSSATNQVTCAYDPNDKQVFPQGYGEPHYILEGTELNYLIRFQNTGNAPAIDVNVADTMSVALDLSSIEITSTSHDMELIVDEDSREVVFSFPNIFLPDSTANEEESHGYIAYKIKTAAALQPETRIENTAYIYFDNNPAIITNTTWNTIFNCATKSQLNLPAVLCENETLELVLDDPFAETYEWNVWPQGTIDLLNESGSMVNWNAPEIGNYSIHMTATNPLCSTEYIEALEVLAAPNATFYSNSNWLELNMTEFGDSYQWFLNGEAVLYANDTFLQIAESGNYSVSVNRENGCFDSSDEIFVLFVGVDEQTTAFKAFPNPCDEQLELRLNEAGTWNLRVLDALGRIVHSNTIQGNNYVLNTKALSNGTYTLVLHGNDELQYLKFMVLH